MLYLTVGDDDIGLNVLAFLPQVVLLVLLTYKYGSIYEVNFCLFCQTLVFVTFNKVQDSIRYITQVTRKERFIV